MKNVTERIMLAVAMILAGAALLVSLTHGGPRGPQGTAGQEGKPGHSAQVSHLGVCWNLGEYITSGNTDPSYSGALTSPSSIDGVSSCPAGQFVSVVPGQ